MQDLEETSLHIACYSCTCNPVTACALAELLLVHGANVNAVRRYLTVENLVRETSLHIAVKAKYLNHISFGNGLIIMTHIVVQIWFDYWCVQAQI